MKTIVRLLKQINLVKFQFIIGIMLLLSSSLANVISPLIIKNIIDNIITPVANGNILNSLLLKNYIILFLICAFLYIIAGYLSTLILTNCTNLICENLRNNAFITIQNLPISYFDNKPAGQISSRIINDIETLRKTFYITCINQIFVQILNISMTYIAIFYLNFKFGIILLMLIPIFIIWNNFYGKKINSMMKLFYESQSEINTQVNETMDGISIIQLFNQEKNIKDKFFNTSKTMQDAGLRLLHVDSTISWSLVDLLQRIFIFIIIFFITHSFLNNSIISTGFLFLMLEYIVKLFTSLGMLVSLFPNIGSSITTGERIFEFLDTKFEENNKNKIEILEGKLEFKNVYFSYKEGFPILKNISFTANKGDTIALVGNTGSGKTSIINLIFRFYDPQSGEILIDGQNIKNFNKESIRDKMGIVLQEPYLFTGTIASNISMNNKDIDETKILTALEKIGAMDMIKKLPKGINEEVIEKGNSLSSGEKQLISFARTLATNPKILILDEATSHIDTETEEIIQNAMNVLKNGRTTFIIAHRLSTIKDANLILVLENGEIIEKGTHEELLNLGGKYSKLYKIQQKI